MAKLKWSFDTQDDSHTTPEVAQETVFFGTNNGKIYALDTEDGNIRWSQDIHSAVQLTPVFDDGVIYTGCLDSLFEPEPAYVYAYHARTGRKKWETEVGDHLRGKPAVTDRQIFVGCQDEKIYALRKYTGGEEWTASMDAKVWGDIIVINDLICTGSQGGDIRAFRRRSGKQEWKLNYGRSVDGLATDGSILYAGGFQEGTNEIWALDSKTGDKKWSMDTGGIVRGLTVHNDTLYYGTTDGCGAVSKRTGSELWSQDSYSDYDSEYSPAIYNGLYFSKDDYEDTVYALDCETGELEWDFNIDSGGDGAVRIANDTLYVVGESGLSAIDISNLSAATRDQEVNTGSDTEVYDASTEEDDSDTRVYQGQSTSEVTFCPSCGSNLDDYDVVNFCPKCGSEI